MKFLIDNNLSPQLSAGLKGFGEDVVHVTEVLAQDAEDTKILAYVGETGSCLVTRDQRIRFRPAELTAIREHRAGVFILGGKNLGRWQLVQQLVRNWPRMKQLAAKENRPFAFRIPPRGAKIVSISIG